MTSSILAQVNNTFDYHNSLFLPKNNVLLGDNRRESYFCNLGLSSYSFFQKIEKHPRCGLHSHLLTMSNHQILVHHVQTMIKISKKPFQKLLNALFQDSSNICSLLIAWAIYGHLETTAYIGPPAIRKLRSCSFFSRLPIFRMLLNNSSVRPWNYAILFSGAKIVLSCQTLYPAENSRNFSDVYSALLSW